jgi:transposase
MWRPELSTLTCAPAHPSVSRGIPWTSTNNEGTRVVGVGVETADMLVQEVFSREIRDRRALARYAGLTGAPDESGQRRRERGLAKAGNARVRRGMIELAGVIWCARKAAR